MAIDSQATRHCERVEQWYRDGWDAVDMEIAVLLQLNLE